ncbi:PIN domain-containing protein [Candidatus Binatia bacterium]|jgi:predicted nucleic acid-binding protein|nr:PIN domain-containing protein [Candidatus Binatia bacterium]
MSVRSFIDTNILLYADSADEPRKQALAIELIEAHLRAGSGVISTQVLHEHAAAAIRKLALGDDVVQDRIELFARFEIVTASVDALKAALALRSMHRMSLWDALILQAARDAGCTVLLSEALATGTTLAGGPSPTPLPPRPRWVAAITLPIPVITMKRSG